MQCSHSALNGGPLLRSTCSFWTTRNEKRQGDTVTLESCQMSGSKRNTQPNNVEEQRSLIKPFPRPAESPGLDCAEEPRPVLRPAAAAYQCVWTLSHARGSVEGLKGPVGFLVNSMRRTSWEIDQRKSNAVLNEHKSYLG